MLILTAAAEAAATTQILPTYAIVLAAAGLAIGMIVAYVASELRAGSDAKRGRRLNIVMVGGFSLSLASMLAAWITEDIMRAAA